MYIIGICDDEAIHRQHIRKLCEDYFAQNSLAYKLVEFASGEEVLDYQGGHLHLLFLDVEMGEINGIDVLRTLEDSDNIWRIVFISNHEEAVWDAFSIKTLEFARKPVEYRQIEKWISVTIRENKENVLLEYLVGTEKRYKTLAEIFCLEAAGNYTYLHGKNEKELVNDNLKQWQGRMEELPFVRVHKSYVINMQHVQRWESDKVTLVNKVELAIGRRFAKEAKEKYLRFVKSQAMKRM